MKIFADDDVMHCPIHSAADCEAFQRDLDSIASWCLCKVADEITLTLSHLSGRSLQKTAESYVGLHHLLDKSICVCLLFMIICFMIAPGWITSA